MEGNLLLGLFFIPMRYCFYVFLVRIPANMGDGLKWGAKLSTPPPIFCQIQHLVSALKALCQRGWKGTLVVTIYICWSNPQWWGWKKWFDTMPCISGARSCFLPESRAPCPPFSGWNPGHIKKSSNVLIPCPCPRDIDKHLCCTILALGFQRML